MNLLMIITLPARDDHVFLSLDISIFKLVPYKSQKNGSGIIGYSSRFAHTMLQIAQDLHQIFFVQILDNMRFLAYDYVNLCNIINEL